MATGYMGFEEPEVAPKGSPEANPPTPETYAKVDNTVVETPTPAAEPVPDQAKPAVEKVAPIVEAKKEIDKPVIEVNPEPAAVAAPAVVEKIVEKIVEKYPEFKNADDKVLYDAWVNGEMDKVKDYWRMMDKNYDTMSDLDVVREGLSAKNPAWTKEDVELELRVEYGKQLEKYNMADFDVEVDPDGYKDALAHNERAEENLLRLQRAARDSRVTLKEQQKLIELPKINKEEPTVAATPAAPTQEQIDESRREWAESATTKVPALADYTFQVGDDKNPEEVVFAITPEEKAARVESMKTWEGNDFMVRRGWKNADGSFNLLKIAEDEHTLENVAKIAKSAYTQGVTNGRKTEVAAIKNIDNEKNRQDAVPAAAADAGELIWS